MAGIIKWSSVGWAASGKVDIGGSRIAIPLEFTVPLKRVPPPNAPEGTQVTLIVVELPSGNNIPNTVNPGDIPVGEFKDFPFRPYVVVTPIEPLKLALVASYAEASTSTTSSKTPLPSAVLPGTEAKIKSGGNAVDLVKLSTEWIWRIKCDGPELGVTNDLIVPLKLDAHSYHGWESPVTLQLLLPDGRVLVTTTVQPKEILLGKFKDFIITSPERPKELDLTVTVKQTGGPGSTLVIGDISYKILAPPK